MNTEIFKPFRLVVTDPISAITRDAAIRGHHLWPDDWNRLARAVKYHYRESGFFRMNVCGWRFAITDTARRHATFSDRLHGFRIGRFVICVNRAILIDGQVRL